MLPFKKIADKIKAITGNTPFHYVEGDISRYQIAAEDIDQLREQHSFQKGTVAIADVPTIYTHGASFVHSWQEIFIDEVYRFIPKTPSPYIIDGGANIGLSTLYFALRHPASRIESYEADPIIFQVLVHNLQQHQCNLKANIQLHQQALWVADTQLTFYEEGALAGSVVGDFGKTGKTRQVEAINIASLLQQPVDMLKLDIEGAENDMLPVLQQHLHQVDYLFIEYHSIQQKPQQLGELLLILGNAGFRYHIREAAILARHPLIEKLGIQRLFDMQLNIWCYRP